MSEEGNSACLSNCSGCLRHLVELCVETAGYPGRCTGVSLPIQLLPSPTGLPSKRCPASGSFQERTGKSGSFGMWHHPWGSFRISSGGRPHPEVCQESREPLPDHAGESPLLSRSGGRRGSDEAVPGPSVFPSREPGVSGDFWGRRKAVRDRFALQGRTGDFP